MVFENKIDHLFTLNGCAHNTDHAVKKNLYYILALCVVWGLVERHLAMAWPTKRNTTCRLAPPRCLSRLCSLITYIGNFDWFNLKQLEAQQSQWEEFEKYSWNDESKIIKFYDVRLWAVSNRIWLNFSVSIQKSENLANWLFFLSSDHARVQEYKTYPGQT